MDSAGSIVAIREEGMPWPPVTVMTFLVEGDPVGVLLEVGASGLPHRILAHQARRIGGVLVAAADLADEGPTCGSARRPR